VTANRSGSAEIRGIQGGDDDDDDDNNNGVLLGPISFHSLSLIGSFRQSSLPLICINLYLPS
jgi:hypothetical protein